MEHPVAHNGTTHSLVSLNMTSAHSSAPDSYYAYPQHSGLMLAHIIVMVVAWLFVLPIGKAS